MNRKDSFIRTSLLVTCLLGVPSLAASSNASAASVEAALRDTYRVSVIEVGYVHQFSELPSNEALRSDVQVQLAEVNGVWVAPGEGGETTQLSLGDIAGVRLSHSAIEAIGESLRGHLEGKFGKRFFVGPDTRDIDAITGADLRPASRTALRYMAEYTGDTQQINEFIVQYARPDLAGQPSIAELMNVSVRLVPAEDHGYVAWRPGVAPIHLTLGEIAAREPELYAESGVQQVLLAVRDYILDRGLMGVHVAPVIADMQAARQTPGNVRLIAVTGVVSEVRTLAAGERFGSGPERINHPVHDRIRERSPVQAGDVLQRDVIDNYIFRLARHPGRRVDVAIAPAEEDLTVTLDYLVTENRPLLLYVQGSNTGTKQTGRWRQRFGLYHSQLTGNDDIFNLDYTTASFKDAHTVSGFYEGRVGDLDRLRWRLHGLWGEFDASEVGFASLRFRGEQWQIGAELIANVYQDKQLFIDLIGGARFMHARVSNFFFQFLIQEGDEDFLIPYLGVRLEKFTEQASTRASIMFEGSLGDATNIKTSTLNRLGRLFPDKDWMTMQWDLMHSFYLEPLFNPKGWADISTPESSTLAHEIALGFRGQYAFDNRLVPHITMVAGGLYSVRGYPESIVAGDSVYIASAEYRFHLPRMFQPTDPDTVFGQPFRWAPQHVYGRPDWDLILRGFVDVARVMQTDRQPFERDETLIGTGVGVEFLFRRNLNLRVDWGIALKELPGRVKSGSSRVHFVGTILF